jgi:hypothetical protein
LRAVRRLAPRDGRAVRDLVELLRKRVSPEARAEAADLLEELMELEQAPQTRAVVAVELARARIELGDVASAERAFVEALAQTPNDEMLAAVLAFAPAPRDRARIFTAAAARATERGHASTRLSFELAAIEIDALGQAAEGVAHARAALALDPNAHRARALLAQGLAKSGKHAEATGAVLAMIDPDATPLLSLANPSASLLVLQESLAAVGRPQEALVARELRAVAGGMERAAVAALRARRLPPSDMEGPPVLDGETLRERVFPEDARSVLLAVAAAIAGTEARVFGEELGAFGLSARDRVGAGHPLWAPFERARRALGLKDVDLAVCDRVPQGQVLMRSNPWVLVPPTLPSQPEPVQVAALVRALTRIALGTAWVERLRTPQVRCLLVAAVRLVVPSYADDLTDGDRAEGANEYVRPLGRAITRAQKKALTALVPTLESARGPTLGEVEAFVLGATRAEARAAFVLTGDALATLDALGAGDRSLSAVMAHPVTADVFRFGLTPKATVLRHELGALWA